jgi:histidinol dehydrogenase
MTPLVFAARGALDTLDDTARTALFARTSSNSADVSSQTSAIVQRVRATGDVALREMAQTFDGVRLDALEVSRARWDTALAALDPELRRAIERAAANIRAVHEAFRPVASEVTTADGAVIGRRPDALARVGVYAPGGRATYPSSLLMGAVPARVAGVREIIVCSPPDASGAPSAVLLAAAAIAGVDRVFAIGGAGAIAAMSAEICSRDSVCRL